jgi:hypothetical protein
MDPNALYYALSTIAQCAAALAALIGFLGMWRLDRLRARPCRPHCNFQNYLGSWAFLVKSGERTVHGISTHGRPVVPSDDQAIAFQYY